MVIRITSRLTFAHPPTHALETNEWETGRKEGGGNKEGANRIQIKTSLRTDCSLARHPLLAPLFSIKAHAN